MITAVRSIDGWRSSWASSVVLPLPRKPVRIVTGIRSAGSPGAWVIGLLSALSASSIRQDLHMPWISITRRLVVKSALLCASWSRRCAQPQSSRIFPDIAASAAQKKHAVMGTVGVGAENEGITALQPGHQTDATKKIQAAIGGHRRRYSRCRKFTKPFGDIIGAKRRLVRSKGLGADLAVSSVSDVRPCNAQ